MIRSAFAARNVVNATQRAWIGLTAPKHECDWTWADGTRYDYSAWDQNYSADGCNGGGRYCTSVTTDVPDSTMRLYKSKWCNWGCDSVPDMGICQKYAIV